MTIPLLFNLRRVIPRWRDSRTSLATGELISFNPSKLHEIGGNDQFGEKLQLWKNERRIEQAAEVVSASIAQGIPEEAVEAAEFLISEKENTKQVVISVANEVLVRSGKQIRKEVSYPQPLETDLTKIFSRIHHFRVQLNEFPRNALMWSDLSLLYVMLGQLNQSRDAMITALFLAPENRFILRAATRLFVHLDEPDHAHRMLLSKEITRHDPWLLAAEIATAAVANETPILTRSGKDMLEKEKIPSFHTAELASAIATLELSSGAVRKARKLFQASLLSPTENSVAQSVWAKKELPSLDTNLAVRNTPRTFEAQALDALRSLNWSDAVDAADLWFADEPYSSRPAEAGSYAALIGLEDYSKAEALTRAALIANPNDLTLINNLAFALANQWRLEEARQILDSADLSISDQIVEVPITATRGLINIRMGNIDVGKALYLEAISRAVHTSHHDLSAMASINFAREMFMAGQMSEQAAVSFAEKACVGLYNPHVNWLLDRLKAIDAHNDL